MYTLTQIVHGNIKGQLNNATLLLHGTTTAPKHILNHGSRHYAGSETKSNQKSKPPTYGGGGGSKSNIEGIPLEVGANGDLISKNDHRWGNIDKDVMDSEGRRILDDKVANGRKKNEDYMKDTINYYNNEGGVGSNIGRDASRRGEGEIMEWSNRPSKKARHIHRQHSEKVRYIFYTNITNIFISLFSEFLLNLK